MSRSVSATRQIILRRPKIESLEAVRVGERNMIGDEPIVVTRFEVHGTYRVLEGWHAETGRLMRWRWTEE